MSTLEQEEFVFYIQVHFNYHNLECAFTKDTGLKTKWFLDGAEYMSQL